MYVDSKVLREEDTGNFFRKSLHIHRLRVKVVMNNGNFFRKSLHIHRLRAVMISSLLSVFSDDVVFS